MALSWSIQCDLFFPTIGKSNTRIPQVSLRGSRRSNATPGIGANIRSLFSPVAKIFIRIVLFESMCVQPTVLFVNRTAIRLQL